jgi:hypothetical protein
MGQLYVGGCGRRFYESPREAEEDLFAAFAAAVAEGTWSPG